MTIELTDTECIIIPTVQNMKVNGLRTNSMEKVEKHGQMVLFTKEIIRMVKRKVKENLFGVMVPRTQEISAKTIFTVL